MRRRVGSPVARRTSTVAWLRVSSRAKDIFICGGVKAVRRLEMLPEFDLETLGIHQPGEGVRDSS